MSNNSIFINTVFEDNPKMKKVAQNVLLRCDMQYLTHAINNNFNQEGKYFCDSIDMVLTHYKWYLYGRNKTLHRVMSEIRNFQKLVLYNHYSVKKLLDIVENEILTNEIYEVMPRHLKAKSRILKAISHVSKI
jgi:hypothetical protein